MVAAARAVVAAQLDGRTVVKAIVVPGNRFEYLEARAALDAIEAGDREAETELREAISAYVIYREITAEGSRLTAIYQVQDEKPSCQIVIKDDKCKTKS